MTFNELNLTADILSAIDQMGYVAPMPVQEAVIPYMLTEQKDLVALAQTGTGKTAAFGLPILQLINPNVAQTQTLILAPTRELCIQIANDMKNYAKYIRNAHIVPIYGGEDIRKQLKELNRTPQIIVATPGRLIDMTKRGKIDLTAISYVVFDEADEMLNMGFKEDIETILKETPKTRRTLLFSATMPSEIQRIAKQYMTDFEEITIGEKNAGSANVEHIYYLSQAKQRYLVLKRIVDLNPDIYAIIFCRTRQETKEVAEKLMKDGYNADALHGDLSQAQRDTVMQKFRLKNIQLLVATDVAARGLDVNDLTHVINYNLPDDVEAYTHRSGRTGRANKTGVAIAIIHSKEKFKIKQIEKIIQRKFEQKPIPNGLEVCKKQLFAQINKMQSVEVNEEQIDPYMEQIMGQLQYLSKEELIKRFVSLEFNRFLEYYENAPDLNIPDRSQKGVDDGTGKRSKRKSGKRVKLKINLGYREGMNPKKILGLINDATNDKSIDIGDIDITNKYTFFESFEDQYEKIIRAFSSIKEIDVATVKGNRSKSQDTHNGHHNTSKGKNSRKTNSDKPWRNRKRK